MVSEHVRGNRIGSSPYNTVMQGKQASEMSEKSIAENSSTTQQIEVTRCPECGTGWETVVTRRRDARATPLEIQV